MEVEKDKSICPSCQNYAELRTCGFLNCFYKCKGRLAVREREIKNIQGETDDDQYFEFSDEKGDMTEWQYLKIKTFKKPIIMLKKNDNFCS
jgi:hypothetical protein